MKVKNWLGLRSSIFNHNEYSRVKDIKRFSVSLAVFCEEPKEADTIPSLRELFEREDPEGFDLIRKAAPEIQKARGMIFEGDPDEEFDLFIDQHPQGKEVPYYLGFLRIDLARRDIVPEFPPDEEIPPDQIKMMKEFAKSQPKPELELVEGFGNAPEIKNLMNYLEENYLRWDEFPKLLT